MEKKTRTSSQDTERGQAGQGIRKITMQARAYIQSGTQSSKVRKAHHTQARHGPSLCLPPAVVRHPSASLPAPSKQQAPRRPPMGLHPLHCRQQSERGGTAATGKQRQPAGTGRAAGAPPHASSISSSPSSPAPAAAAFASGPAPCCSSPPCTQEGGLYMRTIDCWRTTCVRVPLGPCPAAPPRPAHRRGGCM